VRYTPDRLRIGRRGETTTPPTRRGAITSGLSPASAGSYAIRKTSSESTSTIASTRTRERSRRGPEAVVARLDSYAEVSPSLTGVKIWVKAPSVERTHVKPGLEIYPRGRYFTVTGLALGDVRFIAERDEALAAVIAEEFPRVDRDRTPYDGPQKVLVLLDYLERANVAIFAERSNGTAERVYSIRCPWFEEHTDEDESGTRVGQYSDGALFFRCEHAHCRGIREWRQFKAECDPIVYLGRCRRAKGRLR
jgi:hypothetical protein